jgi:mono/diheme cytochrome c family protein
MSSLTRKIPFIVAAWVGVFVLVVAGILFGEHRAYALPEYANRTGESCATCHVNPGGGGPRTMRGLLWAAKGKPDAVPDLPGVLLARGVTDGTELYQIACSSCHGVYGEGMFGATIAGSGLSDNKIRSTILRGKLKSGMPSFDGKFTSDQLDALVTFLTALSNGEVTPQPVEIRLNPAQLQGRPQSTPVPVGGN